MKPEHLLIAPILIPLVAAAIMLFYDDRHRRQRRIVSLTSAVALLFVALELMDMAKDTDAAGNGVVSVYLLGNWPPPFAIVLVLDRLSALMLLLTALLAIPALVFSTARWDGRGQHFHSLFQFLLMGLNGAFLTGDLFNLFVFFEVMLAASYGLLLHGTGRVRVGAGLHYIAVNLLAAMLFLLGVSLIYGTTGTLNMADLATRIPRLTDAERPMVHAAAALLAGAFLIKAAMWPLCFWLPNAYGAASPPVAAVFSLLTKVGVYVVIRLGLLLFGAQAGLSAGFGSNVLAAGGMATMVFGAIGVLQAQDLGRMTGNLVLVSKLTAAGVDPAAVRGHDVVVADAQAPGLFGLAGEFFASGRLDNLSSVHAGLVALEELARVDSSMAITVEAGVSLGAMPIFRFGTEEQKREWLPRLCAGEALGAFGLTEAGGGSDAGSTRTTARLEDGHWVIDGSKAFITNSGTDLTALVTVTAVTGTRPDGGKEISAIIVPSGTPGFAVGQRYSKVGWNASDTRELSFTDVRVPATNLLGEEGKGFIYLMQNLPQERISIAAIAVAAVALAAPANAAALRMMFQGDPYEIDAISAAAKAYEAANPGTTIELIHTPHDSYNEKIGAAVSAGNAQTALQAPRNLNAPLRCRCSALNISCAPLSVSSVCERSNGVGAVCGAMRAAACRTSE